MKEEIGVLLIEDSPDDAVFVTDELEKGDLIVKQRRVDTPRAMKDALTDESWDIILCDYSIPGFGAIPALALLKEMKSDIPVIIISGVIGEETAVEAMRAGAHDFIVKGKYARLVPAVRREIEEYKQLKAREAEAKKQKAEALKQRQLAFTMIMQNPQPLLIIDTKLNIKLANEAFLTLSGFSEEHLQKMNIREFKILKKSGHNLKEALTTKKGVTGRVTVEFPKATHDLEQVTIPLLDKDGEIVSIMAVYNDLTEKLLEEANREELANYITAYLSSMADNLTKLSKGNLEFNLAIAPSSKTTNEARQWFTDINKNLAEVKRALDLLVTDANTLSTAAIEGKLNTRADSGRHQGDFKKIVDGVNRTLDAVIGPLNVAAEYVDRISKGAIPSKITDAYNGDFNTIKNNLNNCIDAVNLLVADANVLAKAAVEGKLDARADISKHHGDFQKIVAGVNSTLDAVIGPLNVAADYVDRISKGAIPSKITDTYNGDFNTIKNNLNNCIDAVNLLVSDANVLAKAAVEGKLATRADASRHQGDFKKIVDGVNRTLDAVIGPLNVAGEYVDKISKGAIPSKITDAYNGDFNTIKNNLNQCIDAVNLLVVDANVLAKAAVDGRLATRADASKHLGDFKKIVDGVNSTLDSVVEPVREALRVSKEYAATNFTVRVDPSLKVAGDWIEFKNALNNIGIGVSKSLRIVSEQITNLASSAEEANASVEEVASGSSQVAKNTQAVGTNAERGSEGIRQVLKAMEDLTSTVSDVATKSENVSKIAHSANLISKEGAELAKKADHGMVGITKNAEEVAGIVNDIKAQMDQIGKIVNVITDLANQTNLLALNAAIEAARAGDAGRGFAVVATEVKSLAQESRASAENIADMIGNLQKRSIQAADAMNSANKTVKEGSQALAETLGAFNKIVASIDQISNNIEDVASASEEQAASVEEVTASVNEVNTLVMGTAKEAMDAAAASEEASAAIDQIGKIIGNVNVIVDNVSKEVGKFRIS
jgi:methyl-accepting chemotaxis protein